MPAGPADGLPHAWQGRACWRVLDTDFGDGTRFLGTWAQRESDLLAPQILHYVGIAPQAPALTRLLERLASWPLLRPCADTLARQYFGLGEGFHRLVLAEGRLQLTLCIGPQVDMLRALQFVADHIHLADTALCEDRWQSKALLRLCRPGTRVRIAQPPATEAAHAALRQAGMRADAHDAGAWVYEPPWTLPTTRHRWRQPPRAPGRCVVLGAGLAGAAVASALALRGWQVEVVDAAPHPAAGASGLPAGLMAAPVSRDDAPRSRLARAGIRLTREACQRGLAAGRDWNPCGALEQPGPTDTDSPDSGTRDTDTDAPDNASAALPAAWPAEAHAWTQPATAIGTPGTNDVPAAPAAPAAAQALAVPGSLWHGHAAWVRPAALVESLLAQPGIRFLGGHAVHQVQHANGEWLLHDEAGTPLARGEMLVLCAAVHSSAIAVQAAQAVGAARLAPMQSVGGSLSGGLQAEGDAAVFPPFAVQGAGHFCSGVPTAAGQSWWTGATFQPRATEATPGPDALQAAHAYNHARLDQLLPGVARHLKGRFAHGEVRAWSGLRCATVDRLPAAGPLDDGAQPQLWISTGMGARGLSYALLCAELLAAEIGAEPLPVEASLARALRPTRPRLLEAAQTSCSTRDISPGS